jgi:DNA-binding NarL/FixJ family response regulator
VSGDADPIRVMILDDHLMFAESVGRLLDEEPGISVVGVLSDSSRAVDRAAQLRPDVALVDFQMAGLDGIAVTCGLKNLDPAIQVVMLTGGVDDAVLVRAIEAGCSGFLTKDRAAGEVAEAVRTVAAGDALVTPSMLTRLLARVARAPDEPTPALTRRELEVLSHLAEGRTNSDIAERMFLSVNTVRNYVQSILTKLGAHSKLEAVAKAVKSGMVSY